MSESKDEYLLWPGVFDEALARVLPAPSYMDGCSRYGRSPAGLTS
jgi:hypothetical protein